MSYAELQCRTHYSFLRGASHPEELVRAAAELGLAGLAITDLDGVYGIPKAYRAVREHPGLKLIVGSELTIEDQEPLTLLATQRAGYGLLCRLITAARAGKPKPKPHERVGIQWERFIELIRAYPEAARGLVVLAHSEREERAPEGGREEAGYLQGCHESRPSGGLDRYEFLKEYFGSRLYLPVSRFLDAGDGPRIERALELGRRYGIPLVATNQVHYHLPSRRRLQDVLTSIRWNVPLHEAGKALFSNAERHLKSGHAMMRLFRDLPDTVTRTLEIAEQCTFSPAELRYRYPSEWIPQGETAQSYLERLTWQGARWRYCGGQEESRQGLPCMEGIPPDVLRQLRHELSLIGELGFADYFLTIWEIVEFARSRKILCQGRGSAANSAVCYCLGITAIDPVRMDLLFERFISAERGEPPDIDVDFEHERREEVIQHIYEKYGRDRAGMVSAIITYREKSALRDVGKALPSAGLVSEFAQEIAGFPRHLSIHSGGFTLSADPIIETVPIEPARMEGRTIVQWDKEDLATIGLLKVDILALGMLSALRKTLDLIPASPRGTLTLATIPAEDTRTYEMIRRADTVGVFQIESRAQMSMLPRLLPKTFYDLVVQVAIVRPGPIVGQMVHPYLRRRRGLESSQSPDPRLEPILSRTLGVPLFQEQVMKMAITMAGFTPGEADELRRAIGAWRSTGTIEKMGNRLKEGLLRSGLPVDFVDRVFLQIRGFAEYGFPESHAASFALLAYASSYLKCHYPAEFTCALINSQPMGFYSNATLLEDAKRHGVQVLPLDPNLSEWDCTLEEGALRIGWRTVRGLGSGTVDALLEERRKGDFRTLPEFLVRTALSEAVLHPLAMAGAFDSFGLDRRSALWTILGFWARKRETTAIQPDLFAQPEYLVACEQGISRSPSPLPGRQEGVQFRSLTEWQSLQADYRSFGFSVHGHPMGALRRELKGRVPPTTSRKVRGARAGDSVRVAGLVIVRQRPPTAKGTAFATLEDEEGFTDLILHSEVYEKYREVFRQSPFLIVSGRLQRDGDMVSVLVSGVHSLV